MSEWTQVKSSILQGRVLGPILSIIHIFINDLPYCVIAYLKIFADGTKIFRDIATIIDSESLQEEIDNLVKWSAKW